MNQPATARRIRSFVRREGRLTSGQQRALDELWPRFGLAADGAPLDLDATFGRHACRVLEIGFGNGESLATMAAAAPATDFIGIEVHRPGVGHLLMRIDALALDNVRVFCADAVEVLERRIPDASLDRLQVFFPDPWHKKRHHKRRLIQPDIVALFARKLAAGGVLHLATDWENYAEHMLDVLRQAPAFANRATDGDYCARPDYRPLTKFETRGQRLGHGVWDLLFTRR
ncbi:tRNA (guanine-N(7)-)-methyltransferase [Plasticicumulans lactativorans]|uniref:tRNA (guanine-N(7)-)-methyltransferase n=1 Tax=Plasticicumulans lactativorans TaxID=1133106 RepID=A0A4R2L004_9GAMM|nr:tRNA (guanosine(46)-N7)-methyltransferase TrmB [Plasticicumulans lactativorans]TCO76986.1 tRNA (guanine-N(7)-)-methyltransferase [Plasticicumulans lactativorans]